MGSIVVNTAGGFTEEMVAGLGAALPGEELVAVGPGEDLPGDVEALVTFTWDPDSVRALLTPAVRWVHCMATGVDRFPFNALCGQVLTCSRGASAVPIAEWVLATVLAYEKQLPETWLHDAPEHWNQARLGEVRDKTLGLFGMGAISTEIARRALPFSMRVLATRRSDTPLPFPEIEPAASIEELFGTCDHVVLAAPSTPATHHVVNAQSLAGAKPGLHLVNISRGALVDQDALVDALDGGRVDRASLDVVDPEPLPAAHPLYRHPKVRLTPHISWSGSSTMVRTAQIFIENVARYRAGDTLEGIVDPAEGY